MTVRDRFFERGDDEMPLDPSLVGHETQPETGTIGAEDIRAFADAIGDASAVYRDEAAALAGGYPRIPAPPTFITRFRVPFEAAGLDVRRTQVLHGEQKYAYERPLYADDTVTVRHRVASLRQLRATGMAVMTTEQLCDSLEGERIATGKATVTVREAPPEAVSTGAALAPPKAHQVAPDGEPMTTLTKHVTQEQINAYAQVSGDSNPIHVDPEAARAVGLDGTIAHGMLSMAFLGQLMTDWLASLAPGGRLARLRVRFQAMVRPGDTLTCAGVLTAREGARQRCDLWIDNTRGERVVTGDADALLP
jgi:acyl dehydratase